MNTKLSGAKLVLVPITCVGKNYFPYVEDLKDRVIKYMDFCETRYLPETEKVGVENPEGMYVTIMDENGTKMLHNNLPALRLDYFQTGGLRQPIFSKISLDSCYVENNVALNVGKVAAFVVWYDLPQFSRANKKDSVITDSISIPIVTNIRSNPFPDSDRMIGKRFRRIMVYPAGTTPDLSVGVDWGTLLNMYLTLRKGSYSVIENVPLSLFFALFQQYKMEFANIIFDFESSFITVGGAGTYPDPVIGKSVFMNLQYEA